MSQYQGNETVNGVVCGKWTYWNVELKYHYAFWGTDEVSPLVLCFYQ